MNVELKPTYLRAKLCDEPLVRTMLQHKWSNENIDFVLPTREEDMNHCDIIQIDKRDPNNNIYYDVKRISPEKINSPNFLFMCKTHNGNDYQLNLERGFFIFIDDISGDFIMISHQTMKYYIDTLKHNRFPNDLCEFILIPKEIMRKDAYYIFVGNDKIRNYLALHRDYNQYEGLLNNKCI